ncbi:coproporphyrinogen III oxidase [Bacillus suaedaesalsae]|uniref:Coproporphyrinogen III oxidase n=1 Tax=Bacillus suaedaesalsae TaxID=2810349 RepID=A0ABS2DGW4_9BACI|nr:coproporphyrinogen III oxidase [Bacillus suaedaesalsae]MBM6617667.1 coproporphyrinogen III oxidase [Bacillus suaedaesalsae]
MKIQLNGIRDERFERPLHHITQLFFEESDLHFGVVENAELTVSILITEEADKVVVTGVGVLANSSKKFESMFENSFKEAETEKKRFTLVKGAVFYVFLTILQDVTGMIQQWGILTGIRPTKLLHKKLQEGKTKEQAHAELREDYKILDSKINLMQAIVDRQLAVVPDLYHLEKELSIYIGIPFCPTKCAYCTFPAYAIGGKQGKVDSFLGGLHYEIREMGKWLKENNINITTIYYGGGTPTSITAEEMDLLYEEMYESFPNVDKVREITVEAGRPDTITPEKLEVLKKWNIDRISINPQSYIQETLKAIGRHHTVEETIDKFHLARSMGMNNINMDLIIGLPGEGVSEFQFTLDETEKLMPESLTVHTLSFKRASEMTKNKEKYKVADRREITEMMGLATQWTNEHGYSPYYLYRQKNILGNLENVGYSLPGQESIYNIMIMEEKQTILGLGCGASSKFVHPVTGKITRFANPKDPKSYNDGYEKYTKDKIAILNELFDLEKTK